MFNNIYRNKKVFVTGHTGFKGSWLVLWLLNMDAHVVGYALEPPTEPSHHDLLNLNVESSLADIRDKDKLHACMQSFKPDIVFHLAAQPLVRQSYKDPLTTFETNVMGTVNVLEACRQTESVRAVVNVTSDKSYKNTGKSAGYKENDPMGGHDPYSASKGCAELITASYQKSFFPRNEFQKRHQTLLASVRAGNIIGGGDWGEDRLIPDVMRATSRNETVVLRNPRSTRPWQHVLDPLAGYLLLGQKLLEGIPEFAGAWNFGPQEIDQETVLDVVRQLQTQWSQIKFKIVPDNEGFHEAELLKLDCSKAKARLGWKPIWNEAAMFEKTVQWYRNFYQSQRVFSQDQLDKYTGEATRLDMPWVVP
ncbi:CDP-glucose 4,6-dehydratase [Thermodesulfobacteriota bacterium]